MKLSPTRAFRGTIINPKDTETKVIDDGLLVIENGTITFIEDLKYIASSSKERMADRGIFVENNQVFFRDIELNANQKAIVPASADTHVHAFQPPGVPGELLEFPNGPDHPPSGWLPRTLRFEHTVQEDPDKAWAIATHRIKQAINNGITSLLYYTTSSYRAAEIVLRVGEDLGVNAVVGYVCMDQNIDVPGLATSHQEAIEATSNLLDVYGPRKVAVIDRFPIAVSSKTRRALVDLCRLEGALLETHMDESANEIDYTRQLYEGRRISKVLRDDGFFRNGRVGLAHAIHTTDKEIHHLSREIENGCQIFVRACPGSNFQLRSHDVHHPKTNTRSTILFPLREWQASGAIVTLGTDQGGGRNTNIFREALDMRGRSVRSGDRPTNIELIRMATTDGSHSLGRKPHQTSIDVGNSANFVVIDMAGSGGAFYNDHDHFQNPELAAARVIEGGQNSENIRAVYNNGRELKFTLR